MGSRTRMTSTSAKSTNSVSNVLAEYEKLVDDEKYSDVTLLVGSQVLSAHKCILACKSRVFAAALGNGMKESIKSTIKIEDVDYDVLKDMLAFMYAGKTEGVEKNAMKLLAAADKYEISELFEICEKKLCQTLSADNVVDYLEFADLHNALELREKAIQYIVINKQSVMKKPDFERLARFREALVLDLLKAPSSDVTCNYCGRYRY